MNDCTRTVIPENNSIQRDEMILEHLSQVHHIARRIHCRLPPCVLLEDLVQAGALGLVDAVNKYDSRKHAKLKVYAEFRIRGAILDSLRESDWSTRSLRRQARRLEEATLQLEARLGREPSESEIAAELALALDELQKLRRDLDGLQTENFEELTASTKLTPAHRHSEDPFSATSHAEVMGLVGKALAELSERERQVVTLCHVKELRMKEIGLALGIGESRVSQIHSAAIVRLREELAQLMAPSNSPRTGPFLS